MCLKSNYASALTLACKMCLDNGIGKNIICQHILWVKYVLSDVPLMSNTHTKLVYKGYTKKCLEIVGVRGC